MLTLNNGVQLPPIGNGVFQSPPDETTEAVRVALMTGYRRIDTAAAYGNDMRSVRESGLRASTGRTWSSRRRCGSPTTATRKTLHAFEKATGKLGFDVIDILILHQPAPDRFETTVAAYKALERLLGEGHVRAIGVSNFMPHHLQRLFERIDVVPALNQIELHPYFTQPAVQRADADHGILTQAWSPIGGITFYPGWGDKRRSVLQDDTIAGIAASHGKTPAQVLLRWHLHEGRSAIPKSTNPGRIAENFDVFDFSLTAEELTTLDSLDTGVRSGPDPDGTDTSRFNRVIPEA